MARRLIDLFETENRLYGGATVTAYTVSGGAKTSTEATLYSAPTGSSTLQNPQTLSSTGRWKQPVYIEDDVILTIAAINAASHDTGIIKVEADDSSELTIASGAVTITSVGRVVHHTVDTESDAASDDLDTINGADHVGQTLILQAANSSRTVSVTESGNIALASAPRALDHANDVLILVWNGTKWCEASFASND